MKLTTKTFLFCLFIVVTSCHSSGKSRTGPAVGGTMSVSSQFTAIKATDSTKKPSPPPPPPPPATDNDNR
jgi:hypothetical protein